jgi:hypothetical protein
MLTALIKFLSLFRGGVEDLGEFILGGLGEKFL